jgi:hypothetical protein
MSLMRAAFRVALDRAQEGRDRAAGLLEQVQKVVDDMACAGRLGEGCLSATTPRAAMTPEAKIIGERQLETVNRSFQPLLKSGAWSWPVTGHINIANGCAGARMTL